AGDLGPEGMVFIPASESPNRKPLLVVASEVSGTTTIFDMSESVGSEVIAPSGVAVDFQANGDVLVNWTDDSDDENGFLIERSTEDGDWMEIGRVFANTTQFYDGGIEHGTTYSYRVFAVKGDSYSDAAESEAALEVAPEQLVDLNVLGSYHSGVFDESAAEIVAYDPDTHRLFVVNANSSQIDVLDASDPADPVLLASHAFEGAGINSVAVKNGIVAVAIENEDSQAAGSVALMDADGNVYATFEAGALPDSVAFSPDGTKVVVANEGEPNDEYTIDPEGSVTVIDLLVNGSINPFAASATQVTFESFN
ncbi:hypothetical protein MLD52_22895, partial [Puniceicoccaceae bacterium K14]|nr:hypothetical protein [Puniceicoccaceae bacterium K14]